jgi:hypothetical protein
MGLAELQALRRQEEKEVPGLRIRTPRQRILDASEVQAKHPDKHIRWVNIKDPEKAEARKEDGYKRLTSEEGGRQIGDQAALFAIPKEQAEEMRLAHQEENEMRLNAHKAEMRRAAEQGAKQLRDQAGLDVSAERLLIDETER